MYTIIAHLKIHSIFFRSRGMEQAAVTQVHDVAAETFGYKK